MAGRTRAPPSSSRRANAGFAPGTGARPRKTEIATRRSVAKSSAPRQPGNSVREKAPTTSGASIAAAPATTFASEMAAARHSPCRSERAAWALIRRRLAQKPVIKVAERLAEQSREQHAQREGAEV